MSGERVERWFVRYAGRVTGPFEADRLRTMALRGQITGVHFLSNDGVRWRPASEVPGILEPAASPDPPAAIGMVQAVPADAPVPPRSVPADPPRPSGRRAVVSGVPVAACAAALVLFAGAASAAARLPAMPEWASDPAQQLRLALRVLQAVSALGALAVLALPADASRAVVVASVSTMLAFVSVLDALPVPWAAAAIAPVPAAAALLAIGRTFPAASRPWAVLVIAIGAASGLVAVILAHRLRGSVGIEPLACAAAAAPGCIAVVVAGARAFGSPFKAPGSTFAWAAAGIGLCVLSVLVHSAVAPGPQAREAAFAACMALGFSGLGWACAPDADGPTRARA